MQLFCDGAITYTWVYDEDKSALRVDHALFPGWLFGLIANAMETAHRIRTLSSASSIDYAMDVEVQTTANSLSHRLDRLPRRPCRKQVLASCRAIRSDRARAGRKSSIS